MKLKAVMKEEKYTVPPFVQGIESKVYKRWLHRAACRHYKRDRDRKRENREITREKYKLAIHAAVIKSAGRDDYTGKSLRWKLIGKYDNKEAKKQRQAYKKKFGNMPTVDHAENGTDPANFIKICSWRVNDCKNDLTLDEFLKVCAAVLKFQNARKKNG